MTYLWKTDKSAIKSFEIKKYFLLGKQLVLNLTINNKNNYIRFPTNKTAVWAEELSRLGIKRANQK